MPDTHFIHLPDSIRQLAGELGFQHCGFVRAERLEEEEKRLQAWLEKGMHAGMSYMEKNIEKRADPRLLVEDARTIIVLLHNYFPQHTVAQENNYCIAKYAYGRDYHAVIKKKLHRIMRLIADHEPGAVSRGFTDSAPVFERAWAAKAGLGWIGKNTNLITKDYGSWVFIAVIISTIELPACNTPIEPDRCGACSKCIDACPTKALTPHRLDANKCIAYLTIEHKGDELPNELQSAFGNRIFGCDICQEVCPWNRKALHTNEPGYLPVMEIASFIKADWESLSEEDFSRIFLNSAIKRLSYRNFIRNIRFVRNNPCTPSCSKRST